MSDLSRTLKELQQEEEVKDSKKPTAELLLDFDEEVDRLFIEGSVYKPQDPTEAYLDRDNHPNPEKLQTEQQSHKHHLTS